MIDVTVVGFGNVGAALSLLLLNNQHALRLNIMEPDAQKEGAFLDLAHGMPLYRQKELHINNESYFLNADFIFFTAGTPNIHGESRLSTAKQNTLLAKEVFESRTFIKTPTVIVITNPVDIVSQAVHHFSGLPASKVVGTGTFLDSVRLNYYLAELSGYDVHAIDAVVLGEHGASQVPVFSLAKLNGVPLLGNPTFSELLLSQAGELTRDAAFQIRETQKGTLYGVAKCAEVVMSYMLSGEEYSLPLSVLTNDYYSDLLNLEKAIYISIPVKIKNGEVALDTSLRFLPYELEVLRKSAAILSETLRSVV